MGQTAVGELTVRGDERPLCDTMPGVSSGDQAYLLGRGIKVMTVPDWTSLSPNDTRWYSTIIRWITPAKECQLKWTLYDDSDDEDDHHHLMRRMQPARGRFARFDLDRQMASTFPCPLSSGQGKVDLWTNPDKVEPFLATWGERLLAAT